MDRAFTIHKRRLEKATTTYEMPEGKTHPTTMLWAKAEEVAGITGTTPKRWLRYGYRTLERALIHLREKPNVKKRAAFLVWAIKFYQNEAS